MQAITLPKSLLVAPHVGLRKPCTKWNLPAESSELQACIEQMKEVLRVTNGFGLAAPQVNIHKQVFILTNPKLFNTNPLQQFLYFINPRFVYQSRKTCVYWESCLSLTDYIYLVERPVSATLEFMDLQGNKQRITDDKLISRGCMHEFDHLNGILASDRGKDKMSKAELADLEKFTNFRRENKDQLFDL